MSKRKYVVVIFYVMPARELMIEYTVINTCHVDKYMLEMKCATKITTVANK